MVLVGSVLVTYRYLAVVRVLGPAGSGAPSGLFRWISVARSAIPAVGVLLGDTGGLGRFVVETKKPRFLFGAKFET